MTTTTQQAVALAVEAELDKELWLTDQCTARLVRLIKLARNQALEEARQKCLSLTEESWVAPDGEWEQREPTRYDCADAIASLKDNT